MIRFYRRFSSSSFAIVAVGLSLATLAAAASAETVIMRDGKTITGPCRLNGKEVAVYRAMTTSYVPRAMIVRIDLDPDEKQEFEKLKPAAERAGASGLCEMGQWLDAHLQFDQADAWYNRAIQADPNHAGARAALGWRHEGHDWVPDYAKQLARAMQGFGNSAADACVTLGKAYAEKGQAKGAELAFRKALVANPEHTEALKLLQPYIAGYKPHNVYRCPLDGKTQAFCPDDHKLFAYMYNALDIVNVDADGKLFAGDESKLTSYFTFDAPVHAAAAGDVISAESKFPDVPIGRIGEFLQANTVCIQHPGGEFTLYAHLKQRSVVVHKGQHVQAGELLGKVGNSGSSSAPHLHFCLYDADGISLPITFTPPDAPKQK